MASYVTPEKNAAYVFYVSLVSQANTKIMQANPTLAAGDAKVAIDDGAPANLATLPAVDADFTKRVKVSLSADEMNGDNITIIFSDAAGSEWCDLAVNLQTTTRQIDDLAIAGDAMTLADDAITSAKFDESTAFPLKAADSGSTYIARTGADSDTLETLSDQIDGVEPADVWAYATRTLTATAASTTAAVTGSALTITAGATYSATLSGMTIPADWLVVWFTLKTDEAQTDAQALVQIVASNPGVGTDGLKHLNGAVATSALQGSLTVNQAGGTVAIEIEAVATVQLDRASALGYDLKVLSGTDTVTLLTSGTASVQLTETKSIA